jgi:hypothetical protein
MQNEFVNIAAHELRTRTQAIVAFLKSWTSLVKEAGTMKRLAEPPPEPEPDDPEKPGSNELTDNEGHA